MTAQAPRTESAQRPETEQQKDAYSESFGNRGSKYDRAMRQVPESRREEFLAVVEELPVENGGLVLDVPAGGGYLGRYLPEGLVHLPFEPVGSFTGSGATDGSLLSFPQASASVDTIVSIAGVHHFDDKRPLFREMARVAKAGGALVLADVHQESRVAGFLDGYIHDSNSTGHRGFYLSDQTSRELAQCGWNVESVRRKHYHWRFDSREQLACYCHLLFDITHDDTGRTLECIATELGIDELPGGQVGMRWDLCVVSAVKAAA